MLTETRPSSRREIPQRAAQPISLSHPAMGTIFSHRAWGQGAEAALQAVQVEANRLEQRFSRFLPESEVSRINQAAGSHPVPVSTETMSILSQALAFTRDCEGLYDITIDPLVDCWRQARSQRKAPGGRSMRLALSLVGYRDLVLDEAAGTAFLRRLGQSLDLGGIVKGYAADRFMDIFRQYGVRSALSNLGGNVSVLGSKPDGSRWQVGVQHPRREEALMGALAVQDQTVVTSGDYQRYYQDRQGRYHHHILHPATGLPARSGLVSVTIVAGRSMLADALSTIIFIAGAGKGLALLRQYPGTQALLIDEDLKITITTGLENSFLPVEKDREITLAEL